MAVMMIVTRRRKRRRELLTKEDKCVVQEETEEEYVNRELEEYEQGEQRTNTHFEKLPYHKTYHYCLS